MNKLQYDGSELDLFKYAMNWKGYWASLITNYLHGEVLEVGAGIGSNALLLRNGRQRRWVCLEPDGALARRLQTRLKASGLESRCEVTSGTLETLAPEELFDVIMHIDVLEHIQDDRAELVRAASHLRPDGRLIVLAPAHEWLFSRFDEKIGHYRRYNKATLVDLVPKCLKLERLLYLDSVGLCASLTNRLLLRQTLPSLREIRIWDGIMIRCSKRLDSFLFYRVGKSVLGVWQYQSDLQVKSC